MKWVIVSWAAAIALSAGLACTPNRAPGEATLHLQGRARLTSASGKPATVFRDQVIRRGQTVRITRGTAVLELPGRRRIEMRAGSAVKVDRTPSVQAGDVLVAADSATETVRAAGSTITVRDGAARIGRRLAVEVGVYAGSVTVTSTGVRLAVPRLREATIPSLGVLPAKASPLRLRSTDSWDRRYLGDAIELTEQLQARSDGLTGQLPTGEGRTPGFFETLLPGLSAQPSFGPSLVNRTRAPGETMVGASIVLAGTQGSFGERWQSVFGFRDEGAAWGLVALDQRVSDVPGLQSTLDAALGRANQFTLQAAAPQPAPGPLDPVLDTVDNLVEGLLDTLTGP